ncbi:TPA: hypothetical protein N0F65_002573 [Lagenidium giganteum]|uniref:Uncharacterized protein n=1 Tax=Lagenidium giganteum TaxID=4803 RepID=A0AAV2YZR2_9STRA|nr:TPA: hypothetical protein N0F65_002573 [Lagenidium giganteum]
MTMVVRISGGSTARVMPPMMIFQNAEKDDLHRQQWRPSFKRHR